MKALLAYDWPGNVRELENCRERACAFSFRTDDSSGRPAQRHSRSARTLSPRATVRPKFCQWELEKQTILGTIAQLNGDKLLAARMLGIGNTTLYRKLKEYVAQD